MKTYTAREVVELGVQMRTAQKAYFRDRDKTALMAAKNAETAFDMAAARIKAEDALAASEARVEAVMQIAASLFPGGYENNLARIRAAITEAGHE